MNHKILDNEQQFEACAKLDGKRKCNHSPDKWERYGTEGDSNLYCTECKEFLEDLRLPNYNSYDVLIPLIVKWCEEHGWFDFLLEIPEWNKAWIRESANATYCAILLKQPPKQLREALLRAAGEWKE